MINKGNGPLPGQEVSTKDLFSDEKTDHKIHLHLSDINDVISEQDIKNVKTYFEDKSTEASGLKNISEGDKNNEGAETNSDVKDTATEDNDEPPRIETPWNILGS